MAGLTAPGLGSGLDINGLVSKLMLVEQQPLTSLAKKEASFQAKLSAYGSIKGTLSSLQTAAQTLASTSTYTGTAPSISDTTVLSASTSGAAAAGTYNISVTQLASAHAVRSDTPYAATTNTFHTGTLAISIGGGAATNITIDSSNNTLAGIRQAINDADAGVTATIINDGTTNRLVLASNTSGVDGAIDVAVTDAGSGGTHALSGLDSAALQETMPAIDAELSINGLSMSRSSNTITDAIDGVTLNLTKGTVATPGITTLTVARNTGTITTAVGAFVKAYNDAVNQLKNATAYDATTNKASTLTGDSTAQSIRSQLRGLVQSTVSGLTGNISRLSDIGIAMQRDGTLTSDAIKLQKAISDPDTDVAGLFTSTTSGNEGIAVRFNSILTGIVGSSGTIASRTEGITGSIKEIGKRREAFNLRLTAIEARYRAQFNALDTALAGMQQTATYLTQQLANLPGVVSSSSN